MKKISTLICVLIICGNVGKSQEVNDTILLENILVIPSPFSNYLYNDNAFGSLHFSTEDVSKSSAFLNESLLNAPSVHVNDATTNPVAQDIQIRGFHTSPLYGLSQEIAVYADGVKKNDLLGDAVFWELMPTFAMQQAQIFVGSQPLFGLNALGGTINYTTKSGFTHPHGAARVSYGSFQRLNTVLEYGGNNEKIGWYAGVNHWREQGWREYSPSNVTNIFGKISRHQTNDKLDVSLQYAKSNLLGNGALPIELLRENEWRNQVFTHPDKTENQLVEANASWAHRFSDNTKSRLILAFKNIQTDILNGDESPFEEFEIDGEEVLAIGDDDDDEIDEDELEFALDTDGNYILATEDNSEAILNTNQVRQSSFSAAYSVTTQWQTDPVAWESQSGIALRRGQAHYTAGGELGFFDDTRSVTGVGTRPTNFDTDVITNVTNLHATTGLNAFINNDLAIQVSAAYNLSSLILKDQIGTELNGNHRFGNLSGALNGYYLLRKNWMLQAALSTSTRNPTAVEVSCADPDAPCRLPNAFLADPPLDVVRAVTAQVGTAYQNQGFKLASTLFITNVLDDIYFVSAGPLRGSGYFDNIGTTRRAGWENTLQIEAAEKLNIELNYTYLHATFQDEFTISSPNHPNEIEEEISIEKGDRIALIPAHNLGGKINYQPIKNLELQWNIRYNSSQYVRGDEANELDPVSGYIRHDAVIRYSLNEKISLWLKSNNLTNARYETFGLLGEADEAGELLEQELENNIFAGPAAPRYMELGFNIKF